MSSSAGQNELTIDNNGRKIYFAGKSDLIVYVGHDGLMDFSLEQSFEGNNDKKRETIILACYSKNFFSHHLKKTGATPLLWTTNLMAPEAYTLHDAINAWAEGKPADQVNLSAAKAYAKYQRCGLKSAQRLLVSGW